MIYEKRFIRDKKGIALFGTIAFIVLILIAIYIILFLPIPAFSKIRGIINYNLIIIGWLVLQVSIVYGYYRLGKLVSRGIGLYKSKLQLWTIKIKSFLITKG